MKQKILITIITLALQLPLWAATGTGDEDKKTGDKKSKEKTVAATAQPFNYTPATTRQFASLEMVADEAVVQAAFQEGIFWEDIDPLDSIQYRISEAKALIGKARELGNELKQLDEQSLFELPAIIDRKVGNLVYTIVIKSMKLKPTHAELEAYMSFVVPQNGKTLTFYAKGLKFTKKGGIVGDATLALVGDYGINFNADKSQLLLKGGLDGTGTFVTMDCDGFKEMGIDAEVKFSRDMLVPENENGEIQEGNVIGAFKTQLSDWNDLVVQISLPDFQVAKMDGVGFSIRDAVFDFSDYRNAPAVKFPDNYESTQMLPDNPNLWRGFYLRELSVRLPAQFETKDGTGRTSFTAYDLLIDNMGLSGTLIAKNLINADNGDMNGWAFSLDSLGIEVQANQLKEAGFNGDIIIPIADEQKPFTYTALINPGNEYIFNVTAAEDLQFEVFKTSKVDIYEASYLEIKVVGGKFRPKANLHGRMSINAKLGDSESSKNVSLADITFEDLTLQSVKPYVQIGNFSFGSEAAQQAMSGMPISINNIGMRSLSDTQIGLDFDLNVNLNESFGGAAGLTVVGDLDTDKSFQSWKYSRIDVNKIMIDIDQGAFKFYGQLIFYRNDAVYGNGFNGILDAEFNPGIKVKASAVFGSVDDMRYWYADALVEFKNGITLFPGVGIYGFGGGAYYRMKMDTDGVGSELGQTNSGIVYVPEPAAGLGLKATVMMGAAPAPATAWNGEATFEMSFFKGGGLRYIAFSGNANIMTAPMEGKFDKLQEKVGKVAEAANKLGDSGGGLLAGAISGGEDNTAAEIYGEVGEAAGAEGAISARMMVSYDFENRVLHGNFEMYINVAGGMIKGVGAGGRAGWAEMYFAPSEWYIYIGTPDDRVGISAGVGPIRANLTSYFMVGTKILNSPPPPDNVSEILGGIDLDYMGDENALGTGKGFAFGAALDIDTGDLGFMMFYARFQAGLGFDIMLKNYGDNVRCKGRDDPLGVNGWYANGQAYAYFDGDVGISVKVFGKRKKVSILQIGAAAVLQAKLPNPFWMRGIVGGRFSVLGGLVKGNCKFEVTLGEECEIIGGSVLDGIQVIADATPQDKDEDIDVFNTPQAVFNMPIGQNFEMIDVDEVKKTFRIKLDHFKLVSDGGEVNGELQWNDEKQVVLFNSFDVLPSMKKIDLKVKVSFEEKKNGSWTKVVVDGKEYFEELNRSFTSGVAPDYIPHHNIAYSYPVINQSNYYSQESTEGYIQLQKGQPYLFDMGNEWDQVGRFSAKDGSKSEFDFAYNTGSREVSYTLPGDINTDQIYAVELINVPAQEAGKVDRNVKTKVNRLDMGNTNIETEISTKEVEGTISELQEEPIFTAYIRSSQYKTLEEKMAAVTDNYSWRRTIRNGNHELGRTIYSTEFFDVAEVSGVKGQQPLLQYRAILNDDYYSKYIHPLNYASYPIDGDIRVSWRNADVMGVPPTKAVYVRQNPGPNAMLTDGDVANGVGANTVISAAFIYNLPHYYELDYLDLQRQAANRYIDTPSSNSRISYLLTTPFPRIRYGYYDVELLYVLPGRNKVTSINPMQLWNSVPD